MKVLDVRRLPVDRVVGTTEGTLAGVHGGPSRDHPDAGARHHAGGGDGDHPAVNAMSILRIGFLSVLQFSGRCQTEEASLPVTVDSFDVTSTTMLVRSHHRATTGSPSMGMANDATARTSPT